MFVDIYNENVIIVFRLWRYYIVQLDFIYQSKADCNKLSHMRIVTVDVFMRCIPLLESSFSTIQCNLNPLNTITNHLFSWPTLSVKQ
jgi:ABC-type antimicrobial peptide transport system permease subunit